ncbi:GumC family protein [Halochromatium glycolicum]|nr:Wzz/FepE/Etk N-terminal domain-containing protein [Halochromatium glycolicum]
MDNGRNALPPGSQPYPAYQIPADPHAHLGPTSMGPTEERDGPDLRALLSVLWRRRYVILGTALFIYLLAFIYQIQLTPRYTASTLLTLQFRSEAVVDIQAVISGLSANESVIQTEMEVISSRRLISQLVDRLNLTRDPEFNPALRDDSSLLQLLDPRTYLSSDWLIALGLEEPPEPLSEAEREQRQRAAVIGRVSSALSVSSPRMAYTIKIAFESENPHTAARLANTLAQVYLDDQLEAKFEATQRATDWLSTRIAELRQRVVAAERAVQAYREEHSLIESGNQGTISEQQLAQLNADLVAAKTQLAEAKARYRQIQDSGPANAAALGEVMKSPMIQRLSQQEADIQREAAELSERYGRKHPEVINVRSELRDIRRSISAEIAKIAKSVENEVELAQARVDDLSATLEDLQAKKAQLEGSRIELRELEREAESSRLLLETFMNRFKEVSTQEGLQKPDARILSAAQPGTQTFPNRQRSLIIALILALGAGVGLAFLLEKLDNGYRTPEQLEQALRMRGLGMVPKLSALKLRGRTPAQYVLQKPASSYGEALRTVYTAITHARAGGARPKRLLVTSSLAGEGKTTFCLSMARLLALAGNNRILLLEADLRRGRVGKALANTGAAAEAPPVSDYLTGEVADWRHCVHTEPDSGLDLIAAGAKVQHPQTLLQSAAMQRLLDEAADSYDLVLIDTPPLLAVADALVLTDHVDATVLLVQWESTPRDAVKSTLAMLRKAHAPEGGVLLTQVDVKKHAYYGYGDYASYYGRYGTYYSN